MSATRWAAGIPKKGPRATIPAEEHRPAAIAAALEVRVGAALVPAEAAERVVVLAEPAVEPVVAASAVFFKARI